MARRCVALDRNGKKVKKMVPKWCLAPFFWIFSHKGTKEHKDHKVFV